MFIPPGFAGVLIPFQQATLARSAAITFGVDVSGATGTQQAICDEIQASFMANLGLIIDSSVTIGPVKMSFGQDGAEAVAAQGTVSNPGGRALVSTPPQVAVLVKKTTALGGRRNRGRFYLPWAVASGSIGETGTLVGTEQTALQTKATAFRTQLAATPSPTPMVLLHQVGSTTPTLVTALTVDARGATQRRRTGR